MSIKLSIIIPAYNSEKYLEECLDSVLKQTLKSIEVIIVDDGSTDKTLKIIKKYSLRDKRIILLSQKNQGAGLARNRAILKAKGNYIAFMDSDDYYPTHDTLEYMYQIALEKKADICGGTLKQVYKDNNTASLVKYGKGYIFEKDGFIFYKDYQFCYGYWRFIYKKNFLLKNNLFFPNYRRWQDPVFMAKAFFLAKKFYALQKATYAYRYIPKKLSAVSYMQVLIAQEELLTFSENKKLNILQSEIYKNLIWSYKAMQSSFKVNNELRKKFLSLLSSINLDVCEQEMRTKVARILNVYKIQKYKVSIIIPVYNRMCYIKSCLDSVLEQTLRNIQIICVDDGSTDDSPKILDEYAQNDTRIFVIHQKNAGAGSARNTGLMHVLGEFILFLDSDDWLENNACHDLYKKTKLFDLDLVHFEGYGYIQETGKFIKQYGQRIDYLPYRKDVYERKEIEIFLDKIPNSVCYHFWRSTFVFDNNLKFPLVKHEDDVFIKKAVLKVSRFGVYKYPFYNRREHLQQCTKQILQNAKGRIESVGQIIDILIASEFPHLFSVKNIVQNYEKMLDRYFPSLPLFKQYECLESYLKVKHSFLKYFENVSEKKNIFSTKNSFFKRIFKFNDDDLLSMKQLSMEKNDDSIAVACTFDADMLFPFLVTLASLARFQKKEKSRYTFYVLADNSITRDIRDDIRLFIKEMNLNTVIKFINADKILPFLKRATITRLSVTVYYRLFLFKIFPKMNKIIFSDVDVFFLHGLKNIWNRSIERSLGAVPHYFLRRKFDWLLENRRLWKENFKNSFNEYVNAGFLIQNLEKIRNRDLFNNICQEIKKRYPLMDQDIINVLFKKDIDFLPLLYCSEPQKMFDSTYKMLFKEGTISKKDLNDLSKPYILHWAGGEKPWINWNAPKADIWWNFVKENPPLYKRYSLYFSLQQKEYDTRII